MSFQIFSRPTTDSPLPKYVNTIYLTDVFKACFHKLAGFLYGRGDFRNILHIKGLRTRKSLGRPPKVPRAKMDEVRHILDGRQIFRQYGKVDWENFLRFLKEVTIKASP
jgi:hypothetical protein